MCAMCNKLCNLLSSVIQGVDRKVQMQIHIWSNRCRRKGKGGRDIDSGKDTQMALDRCTAVN